MSRLKIFIVMLAASAVMFGAAQVWAGSKCHEWTNKIQVSPVDPSQPFGEYKGTINAEYDGISLEIADDVRILQLKANDDGSIQILFECTWTLPDSSTIIMKNNAVLTPTDTPYVYTIDATIEPVLPPWTGLLKGAFGHLHGKGTADFSTLQLGGRQTGVLCW